MFNLKELKFSFKNEDWHDTFVGIKQIPDSDNFVFQLPKGFEKFPVDNFSLVKDLFFNTYKTYKKFFESKKALNEQIPLDGFNETSRGYAVQGKDGDIALYSKLDMFDSILDAYDELTILSVKNKIAQSKDINYSKIHAYLHKAIFIDEDTIFVDEMDLHKKIIDTDTPTLVELFCFIYCEIKIALDEPVDSIRAIALSGEFRDKYLSYQGSLFDEDSFKETISILKYVLDNIDRITPYKDYDYWHFYDAAYKFLYGENISDDESDNLWGITNFSVLWEEMCFTTAKFELTQNRLLFADRNGIPQLFNKFVSPFYFQINDYIGKRRNMRPDLVAIHLDDDATPIEYIRTIRSIPNLWIKKPCGVDFLVIDYKYIEESTCIGKNLSTEREMDLRKQLVYEFALRQNFNKSEAYSQFWIPSFSGDLEQDYEEVDNLHRAFTNSKVKVIKRNFFRLQKFYISSNA